MAQFFPRAGQKSDLRQKQKNFAKKVKVAILEIDVHPQCDQFGLISLLRKRLMEQVT